MSFTSVLFYFFLFLLSVLYFIVPKNYRWIILLIGSYIFYLYADVRLAVYIVFSTCSSYFGARLLKRKRTKYKAAAAEISESADKTALKAKNTKHKKQIIAIVLILNFAILAFFKYADTFVEYTNLFMGLIRAETQLSAMSLILPLGISFYTFQSMGYLIDVYREKIEPDKNIFKFALFVSFFPQLIQGPISRYDELSTQIYEGHKFDFTRVKHGIILILWGLFKKMVIADRIAVIVTRLYGHPEYYSGAYILLAIVSYSIQIYTDFSGGVDVARGTAQIFGIDLPQNFKRPYFAETLPDFWRRWHATLNAWWRDYIFYPITFSKGFLKLGKFCRKVFNAKYGKLIPIYFATMLVRIVNGLWHGADVKYIAFGIYHGTLIILGMLLEPLFTKLAQKLKIKTDTFSWKLFRILRTFGLVCIGRTFGRALNLKDSLYMIYSIRTLFIPYGGKGFGILVDGSLLTLGLTENALFVLFIAILILLFVDIMNEKGVRVREVIERQNILFQWMILLGLIFSIIIFGVYGGDYSSSAFIYQQF